MTYDNNIPKGSLCFLAKTGFFRKPALHNITETNFEIIKELFESTTSCNPSQTLAYAEQAALYGGDEGLFLYIKHTRTIVLNIDSEEENRQTPTINLLTFIYLAKQLLSTDDIRVEQFKKWEKELINTCSPSLLPEHMCSIQDEANRLFQKYCNTSSVSQLTK